MVETAELDTKSLDGIKCHLQRPQDSVRRIVAVAQKPTRRSNIRHLIALALLAGTAARGHADLVTYDMSGTVSSTADMTGTGVLNGPVAVGDRITWTFQYDRSATPVPAKYYYGWIYNQNTATLFNIVDQTTGTHFYSPPGASALQPSILSLGQQVPAVSNAGIVSSTNWAVGTQGLYAHAYMDMIDLSGPLPTTDLASLEMNKIPFDPQWRFLTYSAGTLDEGVSDVVTVKVDPFGDPVSSAPEPGSLTLLALGGLGLAARRLVKNVSGTSFSSARPAS